MPIKPHKPQGGCALGCLGLLSPRIIIVILVLVNDYIGTAFSHWVWPLLGFLVMPITTLAAAVAYHEVLGTDLGDLGYWGLIALGVVLDLGFIGGGSWGLRRRRGKL